MASYNIMGFGSSFGISFCPRITAQDDSLMASTSWIVRILGLGLFLRKVVVDRRSQTVTLEQRMAWFFKRKRHWSFSQVAAVTYGYDDVNPFALFSTTHDAIDRYVVGLRVRGDAEVRLFYFIGDGAFTNDGPLPDWWYWDDYAMDFTGSQERESKLFVQLLSKMIGVTIIPSSLTAE